MGAFSSLPPTRTAIKRSSRMITLIRYRTIVVAVLFGLLPVALIAQNSAEEPRRTNAPPVATGATPRTPDGHPDLSGVWNGLGDNLLGVPNQMANVGIAVESENSTRDVYSGLHIATFPQPTSRRLNNEQAERAATLLRRMGSNRPIYKPQYWDKVKYFDQNANEEDPSNNCMPAGVPRVGIPSYIGQTPSYFVFIYPGQGGLIATQTSYRMIQ